MARIKVKAKVVKKEIRFVLIKRIGCTIKHAMLSLYSFLIIRVILWTVAIMLLIYSFFELLPQKAYVIYNGNTTILPNISSRQCIAEIQSTDFRISDFETLTLLCFDAEINGHSFMGREYEDGSYDDFFEIFIEAQNDWSFIEFMPTGDRGYGEFKHRITTNLSDNSLVNSKINNFHQKYGYSANVNLAVSDGMEIESNYDLHMELNDVNIYYYDDDGNKKTITSTSAYNNEDTIDLCMYHIPVEYCFVAIINGKCKYHSYADSFDHNELQGLLTFTDCQDISVKTTGNLELSYTKERTNYQLQNQDLDLQSKSSLTSIVILDEDYKFNYAIDIKVLGHINSGHVSGFDLLPNFFEWCATNIYVIPMTVFTSILSTVVFKKDNDKEK